MTQADTKAAGGVALLEALADYVAPIRRGESTDYPTNFGTFVNMCTHNRAPQAPALEWAEMHKGRDPIAEAVAYKRAADRRGVVMAACGWISIPAILLALLLGIHLYYGPADGWQRWVAYNIGAVDAVVLMVIFCSYTWHRIGCELPDTGNARAFLDCLNRFGAATRCSIPGMRMSGADLPGQASRALGEQAARFLHYEELSLTIRDLQKRSEACLDAIEAENELARLLDYLVRLGVAINEREAYLDIGREQFLPALRAQLAAAANDTAAPSVAA